MFPIPMHTKGTIDCNTLPSINDSHIQGAKNAQNIESLNRSSQNGNAAHTQTIRSGAACAPAANTSSYPERAGAAAPGARCPRNPSSASHAGRSFPDAHMSDTQPATTPLSPKTIPPLLHPVRKGQKMALFTGQPSHAIHACFGWNASNPQCDLDVSAFLLNENGKVPDEAWFVFYGQTVSPDKSVTFHPDEKTDREKIAIHFPKLHPSIRKIVFVLTINDAFAKKLHFGMIKDAYLRILDAGTEAELVSFRMDEYYSNVISMMIGEVYLHNGIWKFNAIGNGVAKDLAGLCGLYGVEVT